MSYHSILKYHTLRLIGRDEVSVNIVPPPCNLTPNQPTQWSNSLRISTTTAAAGLGACLTPIPLPREGQNRNYHHNGNAIYRDP